MTGTSFDPVELVIDASIGVKRLVPEVYSDESARLLDMRFIRHAPPQFPAEIAQIIWKKVHLRGEITPDEGREILLALLDMPLRIHPTNVLIEDAFDIALRTGRTVYDCVYLALADELDCKMVTADERLHNALKGDRLADRMLWIAEVPDHCSDFQDE